MTPRRSTDRPSLLPLLVALGLAVVVASSGCGLFSTAVPESPVNPIGVPPPNFGTPLFITMLVGVVLMVGALTFVPALALGPIVEHLRLP